jgi:TetR/AcrR family transcriptional regulator, tetracycline repressor protein
MGEAERPRLSRAAVVERGLAIGDAEGLEAVTIRRLATELGVTPMALYWHFRNKEELMTGLADSVWAEIDVKLDPAADWPVQLRGLVESLVGVLRRHPCASTLLVDSEKRKSEAALVATETTLDVLRRAGFDTDHSAALARMALFTGIMLAMSDPGSKPGLTIAERDEAVRQARVRLSLLPPARFPCTIESAAALTACDDPEFHYQFGIDIFMAGVEAMSRR